MKKTNLILLVCLMIGSLNFQLFAGDIIELKTSVSVLKIDSKGNLTISQGKVVHLNKSLSQLWTITLKNSENGKETELLPGKEIKTEKRGGTIVLSKENFLVGQTTVPVKAEFTISVKNDAFCFSGHVNNNSGEWIIKEVRYPNLSGTVVNEKDTKIYWPMSMGECYDNPKSFGSRKSIYPGTWGSMPWFSINSQENGLYIGCHDPERGRKDFRLQFDTEKSFHANITFPGYQAEFTIPDVIVKPYKGSWHNASNYYRAWFDEHFKLPEVSPWIRENSGLMMVIFKQQNGNIMWRYNDIDRICDIAEKLNFKLIGLWGWGVGGHDRLYPNFVPDNAMGGRKELEAAIERAHQRGFKVIMYTNGNIMDTSTDFYTYNGIETAHLNEKMELNFESFIKYNYITPVVLTRGCPGSKVWRKAIEDAASNVQSYGADAVHVDQVGVKSAFLCHSTHHDHELPQDAFTKYRVKMMHDIREKLKKNNPDFLLMTEGTTDLLLTEVDVFHGLGPGSVITDNAFPSLFRYTFPESIIIQLNAIPMLPRYDANYAAIYGIRHEIMCRYEADAEYLATGKMPEKDDYKTVNSPPVLGKILEVSHQEATSYAHQLMQFENDNKEFFRNGKFIDEEGIEYHGEDILAKGFVSGEKIGVVVWNKNLSEKKEFSLSVSGYQLISTSEPGKATASPSSALDANSLRLLVFEKE